MLFNTRANLTSARETSHISLPRGCISLFRPRGGSRVFFFFFVCQVWQAQSFFTNPNLKKTTPIHLETNIVAIKQHIRQVEYVVQSKQQQFKKIF